MANLSNINGKFVVEQTTGYVGIGTTNPNFLIEAAGTNAELALNASAIYRVRSTSNDEFIITKNGVGDRLTIAGGGNVGIGTSSPDAILQIANNDGSSYRFGYGGSSDVYLVADNVYIRSDNGGVNRYTFTPTGLGLGTTSPAVKLDVEGSIRLNSELQIFTGTTDIGQISNSGGALNIQGTSTRDVSLGSDSYPQVIF